jgi:hypothetical protein
MRQASIHEPIAFPQLAFDRIATNASRQDLSSGKARDVRRRIRGRRARQPLVKGAEASPGCVVGLFVCHGKLDHTRERRHDAVQERQR